jgi:hypothetical protein
MHTSINYGQDQLDFIDRQDDFMSVNKVRKAQILCSRLLAYFCRLIICCNLVTFEKMGMNPDNPI